MSIDEIFNLMISIFLTLLMILPVFKFVAIRYDRVRSLVEEMNKIKNLTLWTEEDFIQWRYKRDVTGRPKLNTRWAIAEAKKIVRKYKKDLELLKQKEDEQEAIEAWNKLENTLKERGYR